MIRDLVQLVILLVLAFASSGCESGNAWQKYYDPAGRSAPISFTPRDSVEIRVADYEQFERAGQAMEKYLDDRKLAPEDMTAEDGRMGRQIFLDELRVRVDANTVARLGNSGFTSGQPGRPDDPQLIRFAKSIGADFVVITTKFEGERQGYETVPVFSSTTANANASAWGSRGWGQGTASGSSNTTTYVPVPTTYQEWATFAAFWRRVTPEERKALGSV
jgi:hypothetical protein